jgi:hypothetical protein
MGVELSSYCCQITTASSIKPLDIAAASKLVRNALDAHKHGAGKNYWNKVH